MSKISKILPATTFGFAPMVTNSLGQSYQSGPDLLQIWNLPDQYEQTIFGFSLEKNTPQSWAPFKHKTAIFVNFGLTKIDKEF